jgi:hypothetical protein
MRANLQRALAVVLRLPGLAFDLADDRQRVAVADDRQRVGTGQTFFVD